MLSEERNAYQDLYYSPYLLSTVKDFSGKTFDSEYFETSKPYIMSVAGKCTSANQKFSSLCNEMETLKNKTNAINTFLPAIKSPSKTEQQAKSYPMFSAQHKNGKCTLGKMRYE